MSSSESPTSEPSPGKRRGSEPPGEKEQARLDAALIEAAWDDDVPRARRLVRRGADVNHPDETQQSAYLIATSEGHTELLDLTLANAVRVDAKDSFNGTGLIRAAERGHADVVGRLVRAEIALDHVNELGWTALHEAVILGDGSQEYVDTVRVLLAAGVDAGIPAVRDGMTALEHARAQGFTDIVRLLERADERVRDPDEALLAAARAGHPDDAAIAVRSGARLETRDEDRRTPLLHAVTGRHLDVAKLLVWLGADPDALDAQHDTPWLVTGLTGDVPTARLLMTVDPDLSIRNRYGGLSIIPAAERGHVDYVRYTAISTPIDVNHVNDLGWTALLEAVILGEGTERWQQIVRILLDNGADPDIPDGDGVTALEHARDKGYNEIARLLEHRG